MTSDAKAAFKVKTPSEAFHDYTESEVLRMRETDARFDEDFFRRAQTLVAARLIAAQAEMRVDDLADGAETAPDQQEQGA